MSADILLPLLMVLWIVALYLNFVLLVVLIRHREMRRAEKAVLINVCIGDILYLCNLPFQVVVSAVLNPPETICQIFVFFRTWVNGLNSYSTVTLSIRRYIGITSIRQRFPCERRDLQSAMKLVVCVWILAAIVGIPDVIWPMVDNSRLCIPKVLIGNAPYRLVVHGVIPSLVIATTHILTAVRLNNSTQEMPGESSEALQKIKSSRQRSGRVLVALSAVFFITYVPSLVITFRLWDPLPEGEEQTFVTVFLIICVLALLNPLLNPIAMCIMSNTFRRHCIRYCLCCCCCDCSNPYQRESNQEAITRTGIGTCDGDEADNEEEV